MLVVLGLAEVALRPVGRWCIGVARILRFTGPASCFGLCTSFAMFSLERAGDIVAI
ncbi:hypothetical protein A8U91_02981 [Halomonas elongata]|uniref:Uncharacterized protein n=1 Tax=Halomonas elongata TaxID=2746 RepID=A0A1B8NVE4_HALEL|nr:hypothetical protein [Halomonas elongata]OBX33937.1 hypothetical protein A8U91_02981 [Halomonas elongata]